MKNIHILPTDKPSRIYINLGQLFLEQEYSTSKGESLNHNIYITSDEEIKEGDWVIKKYETKFPESKANGVLQVNKINTNNGYLPNGNYYNFSNYLTVVVYDRPFQGSNDNDISRKSFNSGFKKIILTTDQDLIKDGVQAIDDEFLEWFVKNPSCEEVKVESFVNGNVERIYEIIIPKEEQKQHLIDIMKGDEELGLYDEESKQIKCYCGHTTYCDCSPLEEPKQETLEEVADRLYPYEVGYGVFDRNCEIDIERQRFIEGVEYQKEQDKKLYSEEDLDAFRKFMIQEQNFSKSCLDVFVEQFKKK
jgi:hypothetical protein